MLAVIALAVQGTLQAQLGLYTSKGTFLLAECFKFCISSLLSAKDPKCHSFNSVVLLGISSVIFLVQTNFLLRGIALIANPFLFQLVCQSKLITTALASQGRSTSLASLVGILVGIAIVLKDSSTGRKSGGIISPGFTIGVLYVFGASIGSAIGGKIYEKAITHEKISMWKTMQIVSAFSIILLLPSVGEVAKVTTNPLCLLALCSQIAGGYLVAYVVQKHGNLAKVTASSIGIAIQALFSDSRSNFATLIGTFLVLVSSFPMNKR